MHAKIQPKDSPALELKEIKELIALMKRNDLSVFKMEREGFKIVLKKGIDFPASGGGIPMMAAAPPAAALAPAAAPQAASAPEPATQGGKEITSPMVGTFYRALAPESPPLVEIGQDITEDTVVCIIEAMKVMNEIKAEISGKVAEVMVENGKAVQFGQPLFRVK